MSRLSRILRQCEDQSVATLALKAGASSLQASPYRKPAHSVAADCPVMAGSSPAIVSPFLLPAALALSNTACSSIQEQDSCTALCPLLLAGAAVAAMLCATTGRNVDLLMAAFQAHAHMKQVWKSLCWRRDQAKRLRESVAQSCEDLVLGYALCCHVYDFAKNRSLKGVLTWIKANMSEEQFAMMQQCLKWLGMMWQTCTSDCCEPGDSSLSSER